jgi:superfamily II DNA or RNA helicase
MQLRKWQNNCINAAVKHYKTKQHFFCLATPASGKTMMAATLSKKLRDQGLIDFIICFSPSVTVANSIKETFIEVLNSRFDGVIGASGKSYTYQSMLYLNDEFWHILNSHRVLVIFDEIHHCAGDSKSNTNAWGEPILSYIKGKATYTLALSGTPWRSDSLPITLSEYSGVNGEIRCDYIYGLSEAIKDKVCRSPSIVLIDNENIIVTNQNTEKQIFTSFIDLFNKKIISYSELIQNETALKYILSHAINKLETIRCLNSKAGGLIVASSVAHANVIYKLMSEYFNQDITVVTHKQDNSADIINNFRQSQQAWIVSVGMISEGTDIPRLQVCCHLSRIKTELYFRQILGRVLRITHSNNEKAWLYTFSEHQLNEYAHRLNQEIPEQNIIVSDHFSVHEAKNNINNASDILKGTPSDEDNRQQEIDLTNAQNTVEKISMHTTRIFISDNFRQQIIATFQSPF